MHGCGETNELLPKQEASCNGLAAISHARIHRVRKTQSSVAEKLSKPPTHITVNCRKAFGTTNLDVINQATACGRLSEDDIVFIDRDNYSETVEMSSPRFRLVVLVKCPSSNQDSGFHKTIPVRLKFCCSCNVCSSNRPKD